MERRNHIGFTIAGIFAAVVTWSAPANADPPTAATPCIVVQQPYTTQSLQPRIYEAAPLGSAGGDHSRRGSLGPGLQGGVEAPRSAC